MRLSYYSEPLTEEHGFYNVDDEADYTLDEEGDDYWCHYNDEGEMGHILEQKQSN